MLDTLHAARAYGWRAHFLSGSICHRHEEKSVMERRMRFAIGFLFLISFILTANNQAFSAPTQSCNQTLDHCVADRIAAGSKPANAQTRCAEILSKCKKK
jgi:hypothetical protein